MEPEQRKAAEAELNEKLALMVLAEDEGGKIVLQALKSDVVDYVERLAQQYHTASHQELITTCANLNAKLNLYRALTRAEGHVKELREVLDDTLND